MQQSDEENYKNMDRRHRTEKKDPTRRSSMQKFTQKPSKQYRKIENKSFVENSFQGNQSKLVSLEGKLNESGRKLFDNVQKLGNVPQLPPPPTQSSSRAQHEYTIKKIKKKVVGGQQSSGLSDYSLSFSEKKSFKKANLLTALPGTKSTD